MSRFVDAGAKFAGWVGLGMGLVIVIAFALIIPIQPIVFLIAPLAGVVIGAYANVRAERWRPRGRVLANAAYAGLVTGIGLAVLYVLIRLVFVYGDTGSMPNGARLDCTSGPDCVYQRQLIQERELRREGELAEIGITDGASLEAAVWRELMVTGTGLVLLTLGGSLVGGLGRSFTSPPKGSVPLPKPVSRPAS